jgi:hypothetical protein
VAAAAEGSQVGRALAVYDEWVASYLHDDHARKSDAAMKELQKELADNTTMSAVLGLQEERTGEQGGGLETALQSSGKNSRNFHTQKGMKSTHKGMKNHCFSRKIPFHT